MDVVGLILGLLNFGSMLGNFVIYITDKKAKANLAAGWLNMIGASVLIPLALM